MNRTASVLSPVPVSVTACPGLAEGNAGFAGVPLSAVAVIPDSRNPSGALVPPDVVTKIGPYAPELSGTVSVTLELLLYSSGPWLPLASRTGIEPKLYLAPLSMSPDPVSVTFALDPSDATEVMVAPVRVGMIRSG